MRKSIDELIKKYNKSVYRSQFSPIKSYIDVVTAKLRSKEEVDYMMFKHNGHKNSRGIWSINSSMRDKFGDGREHYFVKIDSKQITGDYTHRCLEDSWFYHEEWFIDCLIATKLLDEELFRI